MPGDDQEVASKVDALYIEAVESLRFSRINQLPYDHRVELFLKAVHQYGLGLDTLAEVLECAGFDSKKIASILDEFADYDPLSIPVSMGAISKKWLLRKLDTKELEEFDEHPFFGDLRKVRESNDEVWLYRSPDWTWDELMGSGGYALLRAGEVVASVETVMN